MFMGKKTVTTTSQATSQGQLPMGKREFIVLAAFLMAVNSLAIDHGRPRLLGLKDAIA